MSINPQWIINSIGDAMVMHDKIIGPPVSELNYHKGNSVKKVSEIGRTIQNVYGIPYGMNDLDDGIFLYLRIFDESESKMLGLSDWDKRLKIRETVFSADKDLFENHLWTGLEDRFSKKREVWVFTYFPDKSDLDARMKVAYEMAEAIVKLKKQVYHVS